MFETERLIIRGIEESDQEALRHGLNQVQYQRFSSHYALAPASDDLIKALMKPRASHELPRFAVCHKPENYDSTVFVKAEDAVTLPMIGVISFQNHAFDFKNRGCTLGMGFHNPQDRGKGYGTEVLKWAFEYGFNELGLHRIALSCYSLNESGIALYRKVGFVEEGRLRESYFSAGKWYDTLLFGMLRSDWEKTKSK